MATLGVLMMKIQRHGLVRLRLGSWLGYTVKAGNRAWGFPSTDSDYDVRFLFVRRLECCLSVQEKGDVTECPIDGQYGIMSQDPIQ